MVIVAESGGDDNDGARGVRILEKTKSECVVVGRGRALMADDGLGVYVGVVRIAELALDGFVSNKRRLVVVILLPI